MPGKHIRCAICNTEFSKKETRDAKACPKCGSKSSVLYIEQDVDLKINWSELKILTTAANSWYEISKDLVEPDTFRAFKALLMRLELLKPDNCATLTEDASSETIH